MSKSPIIVEIGELKTKYAEYDSVYAYVSCYSIDKGYPAIWLVSEEGETIMTATTYLEDAVLDNDENRDVIIKNWSENEGIYEALFDKGLISGIYERIPIGFVEAYKCMMEGALYNAWKEFNGITDA